MKKKYSNEGAMSNESRVAVLENTIGHINETLERIDRRFDKIDQRFDRVEVEMNDFRKDMKQDIRDLNNRLWFNFFWTVAGFAGVLTLIARSFHWF